MFTDDEWRTWRHYLPRRALCPVCNGTGNDPVNAGFAGREWPCNCCGGVGLSSWGAELVHRIIDPEAPLLVTMPDDGLDPDGPA